MLAKLLFIIRSTFPKPTLRDRSVAITFPSRVRLNFGYHCRHCLFLLSMVRRARASIAKASKPRN